MEMIEMSGFGPTDDTPIGEIILEAILGKRNDSGDEE